MPQEENLEPSDVLDLSVLEQGMPGISRNWGSFLAEGSAVCLEHHSHPKGVCLRVTGSFNTSLGIQWATVVTEQVINSWNDKQELVEYGACGVAILAVLKLADYKVIRRARKGTRVDYWLANTESTMPFQEAARLEVSGILQGNETDVARRVRQKTSRTQLSPNSLPAYVVVVEFSAPQSHMVKT